MKCIKNVYFDSSLNNEKVDKILEDLKDGEHPKKFYIITFDKADNYLEIYSANGLEKEIKNGKDVVLVGIAKNRESSKELCSLIVAEQLSLNGRIDKEDLIKGAR